MKKIVIIIFALILSSPILSQKKNLNSYKYIIVNNKFDFLKKVDQYKTSSFLKFLFKKEGFTVYLSN